MKIVLLDRAHSGSDTEEWRKLLATAGHECHVVPVSDSVLNDVTADGRTADVDLFLLASTVSTRVNRTRRADLIGDLEVLRLRTRVANYSHAGLDKVVMQERVKSLGFRTPSTRLLSSVESVRGLLADARTAFVKPRFGHASLGAIGVRSPEIPEGPGRRLFGRTEAELWHLIDADGPIMVQELVDIETEYRVIIVGNTVVRVMSRHPEPPLFREEFDFGAEFNGFGDIPNGLGLEFAELDVVRARSGDLFVLDVNAILNIGFWRRFSSLPCPEEHALLYIDTLTSTE